MALSDDLTKLATRAQEAEAHAAAAQSKAKADLETDVANARASAQPKPTDCTNRPTRIGPESPPGGTTFSAHGASTWRR